jgi:hypothetical protein
MFYDLDAPLPSTRAPNGSFSFDHRAQASRSAPARAFPTDAGHEHTKFLTIRAKAAQRLRRSDLGGASRSAASALSGAPPLGHAEPRNPYTILVGVPDAKTKNQAFSDGWRRNHPWNP